jgi:hypothetical protein
LKNCVPANDLTSWRLEVDPLADVILPFPSTPALLGSFLLRGGRPAFHAFFVSTRAASC